MARLLFIFAPLRSLLAILFSALLPLDGHAQPGGVLQFQPLSIPYGPPMRPVIREPQYRLQLVDANDVHMETDPMRDLNPEEKHVCTDWEIWSVTNPPSLRRTERVWESRCATGVEKVHTHLGDGQFLGSHAGRTALLTDSYYQLRVRHKDSTELWSLPSWRAFQTSPLVQTFPLELADIASTPTPTWEDATGNAIILPVGNSPGLLQVDFVTGELLLAFVGTATAGNQVVNPPPLATHVPTRVVISGGDSSLNLVSSTLQFVDEHGETIVVYLPALNLLPQETAFFWISSNGSSFWGDANQIVPDFSNLARANPIPWRVGEPDYTVEIVATGFQLPVNIAFVPAPSGNPSAPKFYVSELYGTIKVVSNDHTVSTFASGLLNFNPTGSFPGSGELGLSGICVVPGTGVVYAAMLYESAPGSNVFYPKVERMESLDGGRTVSNSTTILDMVGEPQGQSHFISNLTIGPDNKLYVHMGDGFDASTALNLNSFRGKILRVELDGSAPTDNPFYDESDGISATDFIFAYGFRNPFGGAWRASDGRHYQVENGPGSNDRLSQVQAGLSYGWNGSSTSMTTNAMYTWVVPHAPVNIDFIQSSVFQGSGFPIDKFDRAFVTESGSTYALGPSVRGKRIVEFEIDASGTLLSGPTTFVTYTGSGRATAAGLAAGPDGLYFSDLYKDIGAVSPIEAGANILRIRYVGQERQRSRSSRKNSSSNDRD